jgi:hypothetical protein
MSAVKPWAVFPRAGPRGAGLIRCPSAIELSLGRIFMDEQQWPWAPTVFHATEVRHASLELGELSAGIGMRSEAGLENEVIFDRICD